MKLYEVRVSAVTCDPKAIRALDPMGMGRAPFPHSLGDLRVVSVEQAAISHGPMAAYDRGLGVELRGRFEGNKPGEALEAFLEADDGGIDWGDRLSVEVERIA